MKTFLKFPIFTLISGMLLFTACSDDDDTLTDINAAPVSQNLNASVSKGKSLDITLVATDSDYDALTFSIVTPPTLGTVVITENIAKYTPNENADGLDTFTYKANDGNTDSAPSTVTVTVNGFFILNGTYTKNKILTADKIWNLKGRVFIADGATLTIPAGTIIKADGGTGTDATFICIARGGKIDAQGTADKPIVMTSIADDIKVGEKYGSNLTIDNRGLWGGLLILGKAPGSFKGDVSEYQIEGIPASETKGLYGGSDTADNSGTVKYLSIRHGGASIGADNEINGLTLGGVGNGTTISNVEVVANVDDGVEFFGGTVDASNLLVWGQGDDGLDIDQSYAGKISNSIVILTKASDHGLEIDGPEGSMKASFTLENITIIATDESTSSYADFRKGALGTVTKVYAYGFAKGSNFELDATADSTNFSDGTLNFSSMEIVVPIDDSLAGGEIFDDKSDSPDANFENAKNKDGVIFATNVTLGAQTVGATVSDFAWTFANNNSAF